MEAPHDRLFRSHVKFTFDNDPDGGARHHNRITRQFLYLLGHPASENESVRLVVNNSGPMLREDTEPVDTDFLNRYLPHGARGELYRIDDEWWFKDNWERTMRDADWGYKGSDNAGRYRTEWMKRSMEDADDFTNLIQLFKVVTNNKYTQSEIDQLIDPEATLKLTAARGYASDWDTFTQGRGKNAYFYRRADDGRFQFFQWDSDLAYGDPNANFYGGNGYFRAYVERPYHRRLLYAYVQELIRDHTVNSARMEAWLKAEETAAPPPPSTPTSTATGSKPASPPRSATWATARKFPSPSPPDPQKHWSPPTTSSTSPAPRPTASSTSKSRATKKPRPPGPPTPLGPSPTSSSSPAKPPSPSPAPINGEKS